MLIASQALSILKARGLSLISIKKAKEGTVEWTCRTIDGTRATGSNQTYSTPEEAIEAADNHFTQHEEREKERAAAKILSHLEKGKYKVDKAEDGTFSILMPDGSTTTITGQSSITDAVLEAESKGLGGGK